MTNDRIRGIAERYSRDVKAAEQSGARGEPEAQLTSPVSELIRELADAAGIGELILVRESRLDRSRPDFAVLHKRGQGTHHNGFIELKAPSVSVDVSTWRGRNKNQWDLMRQEAEVLMVCNGYEAQVYHHGEEAGLPAALPFEDPSEWDPDGAVALLRRFLALRPRPVTSVTDLSRRLAHRTSDVRDRLLWVLAQNDATARAARNAYHAWMRYVHGLSTERDFADGMSQVLAYGMVLAALSGVDADTDGDGIISVEEARSTLRDISPVMAAAFAPLIDEKSLRDATRVEVGALESLISAVDPERIGRSADRRGEPWLYFYEDFLSVYDPEERRQAGVYYTPTDVVAAMVRIVDELLVTRFKKRMGFGDQNILTLDPAAGSGTFPLEVLDRAGERAEAERGRGGRQQVARILANTLHAFELLPGPYSVSHLRLTQRVREMGEADGLVAKVVLTDTLESPSVEEFQAPLFGDPAVLAAEQRRAKKIKAEERITVVIGNPPYRRVGREVEGRGSGGWVIDGAVPGRETKKSLFDDMLDVAKKHTIFSHHASLYNLYVYFWRWALWKAFEAHGDGPGIVAFITASSWLTGPGFIGLRQLARELCDDVWVLDLGGDNTGADPEENIFAIETPVAIAILVRDDETDTETAATVRYRRIRGDAKEKLAALREMAAAPEPFAGVWDPVAPGWREPFVPSRGGADWAAMPKLADLVPMQQPGCKIGRTWPIAPAEQVLRSRWTRFMRASADEKKALFVTATTGRNISTKVRNMPKLAELGPDTDPNPIVRYGYRSFDRQWTLADPRLAALERPALWASVSDRQLFFVAPMTKQVSEGPTITVTTAVPDLHCFRGAEGGKDVLPLYRDKSAKEPNVTGGLLISIGKAHGGRAPAPEDLAAYVYALLSAPEYQERFAEALQTPGPRVPLTGDPTLWAEAVTLGAELLWLHTYAERFQDSERGRGKAVPSVPGLGWDAAMTMLPETLADVEYDAAAKVLTVGDGKVGGVRPEVWEFSVSGMPVVRKWLGYRTARGTGRAATSAASELDRIRHDEWLDEWNDELLDLLRVLTLTVDEQAVQADLLERICAGPLLSAEELPEPTKAQRKVPRVKQSEDLSLDL